MGPYLRALVGFGGILICLTGFTMMLDAWARARDGEAVLFALVLVAGGVVVAFTLIWPRLGPVHDARPAVAPRRVLSLVLWGLVGGGVLILLSDKNQALLMLVIIPVGVLAARLWRSEE